MFRRVALLACFSIVAIAIAGLGRSPTDVARDGLTARELEVLTLAAAGLSDKLIGERLQLARSTVSNHVATILLKLRAANRAEAVAIAMRDGIIELPPPLIADGG